MPVRPPLQVFVTGEREHATATLRALAVAHGQSARDDAAVIVAEKREIHLHRNVHRGHACGCALLVVPDHSKVGLLARLAALHARRAGVHRFVALIQHFSYARTDAVEREVRELLVQLEIDGDAVPVLRSVLIDVQQPDYVAEKMRDLLAALDDLPPFLAPAPLRVTPPALAFEGALCDAMDPLFVPATRLERVDVEHAETAALAGGSHVYGAPYLDRDETWPRCDGCGRAMGCVLQFDSREVADSPADHGLFVVFTCVDCQVHAVRHHPAPSPERRRAGPPEARVGQEAYAPTPALLRPAARVWQLPRSDVFAAEHPVTAARVQALAEREGHVIDLGRVHSDDDPPGLVPRCPHCQAFLVPLEGESSCDVSLICRTHPMVSARSHVRTSHGTGMFDILQILDGDAAPGAHFGGHQSAIDASPFAVPQCPQCRSSLQHLVQIDVENWCQSLWACREHPASAVFLSARSRSMYFPGDALDDDEDYEPRQGSDDEAWVAVEDE